jgi:hypothetical protein
MKSKKLRRILVPIDFSEESINTLRIAKLLGERLRARLDLVHVIAPLPPTLPPRRAILPMVASAETIVRGALKRLKDFAFEQSVQPLPYSCTTRIGARRQLRSTKLRTGSARISSRSRPVVTQD